MLNSFSDSSGIPCILCNLKFYHHVHKSPPLVCVLSQILNHMMNSELERSELNCPLCNSRYYPGIFLEGLSKIVETHQDSVLSKIIARVLVKITDDVLAKIIDSVVAKIVTSYPLNTSQCYLTQTGYLRHDDHLHFMSVCYRAGTHTCRSLFSVDSGYRMTDNQ